MYDAVEHALREAIRCGATDVTIEIESSLVYHQLAQNGGCIRLVGRRDTCRGLAERLASCTAAAPVTADVASSISARSAALLVRVVAL